MNIRLLLIIWALFVAQFSFAVTVPNLYRAEIVLPLISSEKAVINKAYELAIEEVLVKVSGDVDAVQKVLSLAKKNASKWVAQHAINDEQDLLELDNGIFPAKKVVVNFYPQSIDDFLFEQNLPVWGSNRPSVLLWVIEQNGFERTVAGVESPSIMLNEIAQNALVKGLSIYAPLQDELDRSSLSSPDLWGLFEDPIVEASQRYQTDVISVFKVTELSNGYEGTLMLLLPTEAPIRLYLKGKDQENIAMKVNQSIAKILSERYAAIKSTGNDLLVLLQVSNISNHEILDTIQEYLARLGVVNDVYLTGIQADTAYFTVSLDGDVIKMTNAINLDSIIVKVAANPLDLDKKNVQTYKYNGTKQ